MKNFVEYFFSSCDSLIKKGKLDAASLILDKIYKNFDIKNDKTLLEEYYYLKNRVKEEIYFKNLSLDVKEKYNGFLKELNEYLNNKRYNDALNCSSIALFLTDAAVFKYYIGQIYYILENYGESMCYLNQYIEEGASKYFEAIELLKKMNENILNYKLN